MKSHKSKSPKKNANEEPKTSSFKILTAIGAVTTFTFSVFQWALPLYWEYEPSFKLRFEKNGEYFIKTYYDDQSRQCDLSGTISIDNQSKLPLEIQKTHIYFIPSNEQTCPIPGIKCTQSLNHRELERMTFSALEEHHHITINPITHGHGLFQGKPAERSFTARMNFEDIKSDRLAVMAVQEWGERVILPFLTEAKSRSYAAINGGLPPLALCGLS